MIHSYVVILTRLEHSSDMADKVCETFYFHVGISEAQMCI